ncbi:hypothetical protein KUTeg_008624 [Tegillarca granosa]|uniref:Uncharacterized protein n=1 Tax=Tegillarca granosa TaxID=220873 RepID=A0ABQ9F9P2_TEGGR|nr:hypothetical protein KUTeg_008624 [Tegillarca granosa]
MSLDNDFSSFKEKTVEPVWNLRDDLQFWIQENMQDLRLGSPDVVSKHQEINSTVQNLAELSHGNSDYKIEIEQGIPEEAFDLECYDMDLKVTVLQEAGRHGGWDEDEHFLFVAVYEQYPHEMPNRRKLIMDRLKRHFPKKSRSELVRLWREQKMESIMLQQKIHEQKMEEMQEKLKMEEERDRKKREEDKLLVQKFYEERNRKRREQEAKYEERLEELKKIMEEQAKYDKERVAFREQQIALKNEEKERKKEEIEEEKREVERRLEALRQQVRVVAESNPERLIQNTQAWQNRLAGEEEDINIQKPLFDITGFTAKQITSDPRLKLEQRLREAGLHNSDYARHVLANVAPPQPPRRDMESNEK